jgi:hypothetical protein
MINNQLDEVALFVVIDVGGSLGKLKNNLK